MTRNPRVRTRLAGRLAGLLAVRKSVFPSRVGGAGVLLAVVLAMAVGLRMIPLFQPNPTAATIEYDAGVYYTASSLLVDGVAPYRDFDFLHPPGVLVLLAPVAQLGGESGGRLGFMLARVLVVLVAALNVLLVAALARRWRGPWAGVLAAVIYATQATALESESTLLLEPFLNLFSLAAVAAWDPGSDQPRSRARALVTGILLAAAVSIKLWAVVYVVVLVGHGALRREWRNGIWLIIGLAGTVAAVWLPFVVADAPAFVRQVFLVQSARPPGGITTLPERLSAMFNLSHDGAGIAIGVLAVGWAVWTRSERGLVWATVLGLSAALFLLSPAYYIHYGAFLAPSVAILVGSWLIAAARWLQDAGRTRARALLGLGLVAALVVVSVRAVGLQSSLAGPTPDFGAAIAGIVPRDSCVGAGNPTWLVLADRTSGPTAGAAPVADIFAAQMLAAVDANPTRYPDEHAALESAASQQLLRAYIASCPYFVASRDRASSFTDATERWLAAEFSLAADWTGTGGPQLWRSR